MSCSEWPRSKCIFINLLTLEVVICKEFLEIPLTKISIADNNKMTDIWMEIGWFSNRTGTLIRWWLEGAIGITWILVQFDYIWVFVLCTLSSSDIPVFVLNQPNEIKITECSLPYQKHNSHCLMQIPLSMLTVHTGIVLSLQFF